MIKQKPGKKERSNEGDVWQRNPLAGREESNQHLHCIQKGRDRNSGAEEKAERERQRQRKRVRACKER